jgi:CIC family chloride channel protein
MASRFNVFSDPSNRVATLLRQMRPSDNVLLLGLAVLVGFSTALALWIFREAIAIFHWLFVEQLAENILNNLDKISFAVALAIAGLIIGLIKNRFVGHERYHGVAGIMESVALAGGRLRYKTMPFKALASAMSLGAGASVGPEDPSVQIGSNLGSLFGQRLHLNEEMVRLLVSAGAASAISAAFSAPIAGVFFALEVVLHGELATASVSVVILSAVVASGVTQGMDLGEAAMGPFDFTLKSMLEVPFYVPLGLMLAPFAALFIHQAYWQYDLWHKRIHLPGSVRTAFAGLLIGIVGIWFPEIMGSNREAMNAVLNGEMDYVLATLVLLAMAKLIMTSISLAAGFVGGIFAPSLFIGTMLGNFYGHVVVNLFGTTAGDPRAFAIAGMAGMMAGVVRAPITAIMLVFELTNDYRFILPIMLVSVVCIFISERFAKFSVYELGLTRNGIRLQHGRDVDVMQGVTVGEAMFSPAPTINELANLRELRDGFRFHHRNALCVIDGDGQLSGIVTLSDLQNAFSTSDHHEDLTVADVCTRDVLTTRPDDVLWTAIRNMGARDVGRLPVVDPRTDKLVGMLNRHDVVDAYNTAIQRKLSDQQMAEQVRLNTLTGAHVYEMHVKHRSPICGQMIKEIQWPPEAVVASIQRRGRLIVPSGASKIAPDDVLMIVADPHSEFELMRLFGYQKALI